MTGGDVSAWLRANAMPLATLDPACDDFSDLEGLKEVVGDARVVAIGESAHRVHESYQLRHRLLRFLVAEMGFGAYVLESGFPEGVRVGEWVLGGPGELDDVLWNGITYHFGKCREMRAQLEWMRSWNAGHEHKVRFYGGDLPGYAVSSRPATEIVLDFLDEVDPAYAGSLRRTLLPLYDYLPEDLTGLAWQVPAVQAYLALVPEKRHELSAQIASMAARLRAMQVVYSGCSSPDRAETASRCALAALQLDQFTEVGTDAATRAYEGANVRDAAFADNVRWILEREGRIVLAAHNGHIQRWPFLTPTMTMLGQHLAPMLGDDMVVIGTTFGGGSMWAHRPKEGGPPGHTEAYVEDLPPPDPRTIDALLAEAGLPLYLLDLRKVPGKGPVADRFRAATGIRTGPLTIDVDPLAAYDALVHVDRLSPWETLIKS